jgi:hypothetical protein
MAHGQLELGSRDGAARVVRDLKLPFIGLEAPVSEHQRAYAVAFLAHLLRYSRAWLYRYFASLVSDSNLVWELNLGAPTATWAKGAALHADYQRLGCAAWKLSQYSVITFDRALDLARATASENHTDGLDSLAVLPEFAAQNAGYVQSPQRQDGLYLLTDIGAGTLDVACFRIMMYNDANRYPVFGCRVDPLGTHYLMGARDAEASCDHPDWNDARTVPPSEKLAVEWGCDVRDLLNADRRFAAMVCAVVRGVLAYTRYRKDHRAPEWSSTPLPVFVTGGGAHVDVYRKAIERAFEASHIKLRFRSSIGPESCIARVDFTADDFARLSVAYGLTFDALSIGERIPPNEIPDDILPDPVEFISHENLYSSR